MLADAIRHTIRVLALCAVVALLAPCVVAQERALDVVLVLDASASMVRNDPARTVSRASADLVRRLSEREAAGVVLFGTSARAVVPLAPLDRPGQRDALLAEISGLDYSEKLTDMAAGVERGIYELREHGRPDSNRAIVFVSDGLLDSGSPERDRERTAWLRNDLLVEASRQHVHLFAVAYSEDADYMLIREMATATGGEYYRALNGAEVAGVFSTIAARIVGTDFEAAAKPSPEPVREAPAPPPVPEPKRDTSILAGILAALSLAIVGALLVRRFRTRRRSRQVGSTGGGQLPAALIDLESGRHIPILRSSFLVGRDETNDIVIGSGTVSSKHARIDFKDGQFALTDLRSTNGTYLNGKRVAAEVILRDGDLVLFDDFRYQFIGGPARHSDTVVRSGIGQLTDNIPVKGSRRQGSTLKLEETGDDGLRRRD